MYPDNFYTPNIFVRIGLFVLTVIIAAFSFGLVALLFLSAANEKFFGDIFLFFGIVIYAALEVIIKQKNHYKSGADDALLWMAGACITGGINQVTIISETTNCLLLFSIALYFLLRFANAVMGAVVVIALYLAMFLIYTKLGNIGKITAPFFMGMLCMGIYFFIKYLAQKESYKLYQKAFTAMEIAALICLYATVNYFVVKEAASTMFNLHLNAATPVAGGWLFWMFTFIIPVLYILKGIINKDVIILRVGLLLVAAIVFTVRYYYNILPLEIAMTTGGICLIGIAYCFIKFLKQPKKGFTSSELYHKNAEGKTNLEALIIAETFSGTNQTTSTENFGGGNFGGGGASGDF